MPFKKLSSLKEELGNAVRLFELDKTGEASKETAKVLAGINELINELAKGYKAALLENKFPDLENDLDKISNLTTETSTQDPSKRVMDLLIRTERALYRLEGEINHVHPQPSKLILWIKKNKRRLGMGAAAIILIVLFMKYQSRKHGLVGEYFNDTEFGTLYKKRVDPSINFNWENDGPFSKKDEFSVRWTGFLMVPDSGPIEFSTISDDGVRLWIDGQLLIDNWERHAAKTDIANVDLSKGPHAIRLEFYELTRQAQIQLFWKQSAEKREELKAEIIPSQNFIASKKYLKPGTWEK